MFTWILRFHSRVFLKVMVLQVYISLNLSSGNQSSNLIVEHDMLKGTSHNKTMRRKMLKMKVSNSG